MSGMKKNFEEVFEIVDETASLIDTSTTHIETFQEKFIRKKLVMKIPLFILGTSLGVIVLFIVGMPVWFPESIASLPTKLSIITLGLTALFIVVGLIIWNYFAGLPGEVPYFWLYWIVYGIIAVSTGVWFIYSSVHHWINIGTLYDMHVDPNWFPVTCEGINITVTTPININTVFRGVEIGFAISNSVCILIVSSITGILFIYSKLQKDSVIAATQMKNLGVLKKIQIAKEVYDNRIEYFKSASVITGAQLRKPDKEKVYDEED